MARPTNLYPQWGPPAKQSRCPTCHQPVITGETGPAPLWPVTLTPTPLTPLGCLQALHHHTRLYRITISPTNKTRITRHGHTNHNPSSKPLASNQHIYPAHHCHHHPYHHHPPQHTQQQTTPWPDDQPPF